jgi:hypothetical protein
MRYLTRVRVAGLVLFLLTCPVQARAECGYPLALYGNLPVAEVVLLSGGESVVSGVDMTYQAVASGQGACGVNAHIDIPGVGASWYPRATTPPTTTTGFHFGNTLVYPNSEIGGAIGMLGGTATVDDKVALGVSPGSLSGVAFPQVGALDLLYFGPDEISCSNITNWPFPDGCNAYTIAQVKVYLEDVVVVSTLPFLFQ